MAKMGWGVPDLVLAVGPAEATVSLQPRPLTGANRSRPFVSQFINLRSAKT